MTPQRIRLEIAKLLLNSGYVEAAEPAIDVVSSEVRETGAQLQNFLAKPEPLLTLIEPATTVVEAYEIIAKASGDWWDRNPTGWVEPPVAETLVRPQYSAYSVCASGAGPNIASWSIADLYFTDVREAAIVLVQESFIADVAGAVVYKQEDELDLPAWEGCFALLQLWLSNLEVDDMYFNEALRELEGILNMVGEVRWSLGYLPDLPRVIDFFEYSDAPDLGEFDEDNPKHWEWLMGALQPTGG